MIAGASSRSVKVGDDGGVDVGGFGGRDSVGVGVDAGEVLHNSLDPSSPSPHLLATPTGEVAAAVAPLEVKQEETPPDMETLAVKTETVSVAPAPNRDGGGDSTPGIAGANEKEEEPTAAKAGNGAAGFVGQPLDADVDVDVHVGGVGDGGDDGGVVPVGPRPRAPGSSWEEEKAQSLREVCFVCHCFVAVGVA